MTQTLDDYAKRYKDGKNMAELKQFPLGDGGILACGKGVEPNTTVAVVAVVAGANHVDMMAVEEAYPVDSGSSICGVLVRRAALVGFRGLSRLMMSQ
jgi:hypothetical protein